MTDLKKLEERLEALETQLAYQDQTIEDLKQRHYRTMESAGSLQSENLATRRRAGRTRSIRWPRTRG